MGGLAFYGLHQGGNIYNWLACASENINRPEVRVPAFMMFWVFLMQNVAHQSLP